MEAEDVLKLYDSFWFQMVILKETPASPKSTGSEAIPDYQNQVEQDSPKPKLSRIETFHSRSMSDSMSSLKLDFLSPDSVLPISSKLQTILSGKEVKDPEIGEPKLSHIDDLPNKKNITTPTRRRKKKSTSKSLSDLEFEELKGFMDLGFVFSEEDKDSSLASIIPGLQRLGNEEKENIDESEITRPYLSEAWEIQEKGKRENNPILMNWRVPSLNNEMDVKGSLRLWAHTVASTVR